MELMEGGDLEHALNTPAADGSRERELAWGRGGWRIALQIAVGLDYLHKARIAHLDLKSRRALHRGPTLLAPCGSGRDWPTAGGVRAPALLGRHRAPGLG